VLCGNPQADRSAVIKDVDREALEPDDFGETVDRPRKILERVCGTQGGRACRLTKSPGGQAPRGESGRRAVVSNRGTCGRRSESRAVRAMSERPSTGFAIRNLQALNIAAR